ncbi:FAD-dependent pyridine nucleotide-disulfide oxidoreductase OS=Tsukamurella paurometabola (strain ATCC 8368 / DSM / CCUG 35730 / CIP 100753 / JCM 10117 /KCTC 9821 / NBRC 16120 / NCIMB 702349 / NCTC 13040) OX=521096 GN=Tpau_2747 PE=4 SV=1 [Tsukamurella paurometabola]|uniref:FAD-dependent pyridine nucleotide-disulfide oxidoreductase n=1 Tax=Tsukamurella paurometabola (strain ATCC 8368 / DSM 20162 / CCUG 35730 / CIP 100753 / JCM 10117 / KCTC 9821 / NBRC 16120 / NCIMB 702349 / NCTC 13040) TaxID=521096 RepID=D5USS4_TSUPD|nr:FAD-dependent oxidoreductase [Tsukamurella paurometabola]ADG79345.1 FAD-dependent pyridine nucleotide-disulfide oxidoreductase [Tsukamurella paurometabola DSM 20162]SUP35177.1 Rhodocoxin reductase [Tsukamurella paurometabola]
MSDGVVIVGTGVAGATAALALRSGGYDGAITLVGREPHLPYRRPTLSKDVLLAGMEVEKALLKPAAHWDEAGISIRTSVSATGGDTAAHTLELSDGSTLGYRSLVLATGGTPRHLAGLEPGPRVKYLREFADALALRDELGRAGSVIVLGAGLIGSEVASAAAKLGVKVTVVEPAPLPLARVVPPAVGERLGALQRGAGVELLLGVRPGEIGIDPEQVAVSLPGRGVLVADLLVVAVGSSADTGLAERLALRVDDGIVVDERYRSSAEDVYAIGDCARVPNPIEGGTYRAENWSAAQDQGTALAQVLLGGNPAPTVPWGWSNQFGAVLQFAGWPAADDALEVDGTVEPVEGGTFVARCSRDGSLVGAVAMGRPKELRAVRGELAEMITAAGVP